MPAGDDICPQPAGEVGRINQACDTAVLHETSVWSSSPAVIWRVDAGRGPAVTEDMGPAQTLACLPSQEWPGGDSEGLHLGRSWIVRDVRDTAISAASRDTWSVLGLRWGPELHSSGDRLHTLRAGSIIN